MKQGRMNFELWRREKTTKSKQIDIVSYKDHKKAIQDHTTVGDKMPSRMRPNMAMAVEISNKTNRGHTRSHKDIQGKTRQTQQFNTIMCHRSTFFVPLHNFCSIWDIFTPKRTRTTTKLLLGPLNVTRGQ